MRLRRCIASKTGLFDNRTFEFDKRLTIIHGKNGSGKSVLARSIVDLVWNNFTGCDLIENGFNKDMYLNAEILFADDNKYRFINNGKGAYSINFNTSNNFEENIFTEDNNVESIKDEQFLDGISHDKFLPLKEFFSHCDRKFFLNTSFIQSFSDLNGEDFLDYNIIKKIFLEDKNRFFQSYKKIKSFYTNNNNKLFTEINKIEKKYQEYGKKLKINEIKSSRVEKLFNEKRKINDELKEFKQKIDKLEKEINILKKIKLLMHEGSNIGSLFRKIKEDVLNEQDKRKDLKIKEKNVISKFPEFKNTEIDNFKDLDELQDVYLDIVSINNRKDRLIYKWEKIKSKFKQILSIVNLILFPVIIFVLYVNNFILSNIIYILGSIFLFFIIFLIAVNIIPLKLFYKDHIEKLEEDALGIQDEINNILNKSSIRIDDLNNTELYSFLLQYFENYVNYSEHSGEIINMRSELLEEKELRNIKRELEDLKERNDSTDVEIKKLKESLTGEFSCEINSEEIEKSIFEIEKEISQLNNKINNKNSIIIQINEETEKKNDIDDKEDFINKRDLKLRQLNKLNRNKNIINGLIEIIEDAIKISESEQIQRLAYSSLNIFNRLTDNQHITSFDLQRMNNFIINRETEDKINSSILHFLILSIKLALSEFLHDSDLSLPLIIDDPLLLMDDDRIDIFKEMIIDISSKRQVVLFTNKTECKDWGKFLEL